MKLPLKSILLLALMLASAALSAVMRPTLLLASERPPATSLGAVVPTAFGDWRELPDQPVLIVDPQQKQVIDQLYSETLSRTYIDNRGYRIMLSIAYGRNQSESLQMHKPEFCYPAQGFLLEDKQPSRLDILGKPMPATQLVTNLDRRHEPLIYWAVVGDYIVHGDLSKKLIELRYALTGRIPDGMLVRVSSIDPDDGKAHAIQQQFAAELIRAIAPEQRSRFVGNPDSY